MENHSGVDNSVFCGHRLGHDPGSSPEFGFGLLDLQLEVGVVERC